MRIFKFGGVSTKDAAGIKKVAKIIKSQTDSRLLVVVSALGKTTNAMEKLLDAYYHNKPDKENVFYSIKDLHFFILNELFDSKQENIFNEINNLFDSLYEHINGKLNKNYDFEYDQIVSFGELFASKIVYFYLKNNNVPIEWIDVRNIIKTDNTYREGQVDWDRTVLKIRKIIEPFYTETENKIVITQGFISGTGEGFTTTLGREGSDFSAAILGYSLNAESVTIWKDVDGLLNADPQLFDDTVKLDKISYEEAIELAYYGASIIHPKTLKPLQNKKIPLYVKSFIHENNEGSIIYNFNIKQQIPCYIVKKNQVLISLSPKDLSFVATENLSAIFGLFAFYGIKINLMQNSAVSFSICVDNKLNISELIEELQTKFYVKYNSEAELFTIRNYNKNSIEKITKNKTVILEQKNRTTVQYVVNG